MRQKIWVCFLSCLFLVSAALLIVYVKTHSIPVLEPKGLIAEKQRDLIIIATLLMCIVVIPVFVLTGLFAYRYREGKKAKYTPNWAHSTLGEVIWWGVPCVIIVILAIITWQSTHALNPFRPLESKKEALPIQVVALDWKWLFIYPDLGIATVNYVGFPEQTPLNFEITADAPMNSFWIPQLGGQIYAMPAMRTKLHLIAKEPGVFRGASSNLSGKGFAGMAFQAVASTEEDFEDWVRSVKASPYRLTKKEYERLSAPSEYDPVRYYSSVDLDLFEHIVMKYTESNSSVGECQGSVRDLNQAQPTSKQSNLNKLLDTDGFKGRDKPTQAEPTLESRTVYTQMNSEIGNMARRRPDFESSVADAEATQLKKLGDAGRFKSGGCSTQPGTNL